MVKNSLYLLMVTLGFVGLFATGAQAQTTDTVTVTYQVDEIHVISVSSNTASLRITTAVPGSAPTNVSHTSTTWAVTHNDSVAPDLKVQGKINSAMPTGLTLTVTLAAPTASGTSSGAVAMTTTAQDLVTGVKIVTQSGIAMTITLSATAAAGPIASATKTLTLSLADS